MTDITERLRARQQLRQSRSPGDLTTHPVVVNDALCNEAADEIERLRTAVNDWLYANGPDGWIDKLRTDNERLRAALRVAVTQNEHDMLMTGEECRVARAALGEKT